MRILITNDDGIESPGLALLERVAHTISDDVWVVSPEFDHSGFSHSLTLSDPMRLRQVAPRRFALKGTPADCVIMASRRLLGGRCRADLLDGPTIGGLVGAAAGGLAGSQIGKGKGQLAATAVGTLVGFVLGQQVGQSLSRTEETCFSRTFEHVPDRETIVWNDGRHNAQYQVMPVRTSEPMNGMYCREYQAKATVGGKVSETYGTACRQPDGSWKLMN